MANTHTTQSSTESDDIERNAQTIASRLHTRGVALDGSETPDQLLQIEEAIEAFEFAVSSHGGDLMVDETPRGGTPQPDDAHFALPLRGDDMSVSAYLLKLARATDVIRHHTGPRGD